MQMSLVQIYNLFHKFKINANDLLFHIKPSGVTEIITLRDLYTVDHKPDN